MGIKFSLENKKGFTIIEVVLVLAIAGLIFLMVFIALPGMQRNQRDTQRRDDYAALATNVTNYMTNNNGKLPTDCGAGKKFGPNQLNSEGKDPNQNEYDLHCTESRDEATKAVKEIGRDDTTKVYVVREATCKDGQLASTNSKRAFAIYGDLESGTYCNPSN